MESASGKAIPLSHANLTRVSAKDANATRIRQIVVNSTRNKRFKKFRVTFILFYDTVQPERSYAELRAGEYMETRIRGRPQGLAKIIAKLEKSEYVTLLDVPRDVKLRLWNAKVMPEAIPAMKRIMWIHAHYDDWLKQRDAKTASEYAKIEKTPEELEMRRKRFYYADNPRVQSAAETITTLSGLEGHKRNVEINGAQPEHDIQEVRIIEKRARIALHEFYEEMNKEVNAAINAMKFKPGDITFI